MDISGNYTSPLESLFLFHFIVALIDLRGNSYITKYSLNAKAGKQWGKSVFLDNLNKKLLCGLHSREQSDSGLSPSMRMSWEKEITVPEPMWTVEIAIVT